MVALAPAFWSRNPISSGPSQAAENETSVEAAWTRP
jgi:hypothetical protein